MKRNNNKSRNRQLKKSSIKSKSRNKNKSNSNKKRKLLNKMVIKKKTMEKLRKKLTLRDFLL